MRSDIKAIGFDLDGTLYAPNEEINERIINFTCKRAAEILGRPYKEVRGEFNSYFAELQSGASSLKRLGVNNGRELVQEALEKADIASVLEEDPKLSKMLIKLAKEYDLFLITSSIKEHALEKLKAIGINSNIFGIALYLDPNLRRQDGSAFRYVSGLFNVPLEQMMFVGDREKVDIIPAQKLGLVTVIVHEKSDLADYQLNNIYDLERILK